MAISNGDSRRIGNVRLFATGYCPITLLDGVDQGGGGACLYLHPLCGHHGRCPTWTHSHLHAQLTPLKFLHGGRLQDQQMEMASSVLKGFLQDESKLQGHRHMQGFGSGARLQWAVGRSGRFRRIRLACRQPSPENPAKNADAGAVPGACPPLEEARSCEGLVLRRQYPHVTALMSWDFAVGLKIGIRVWRDHETD